MKLPKNYHPDFRIPGKKPVGRVEVECGLKVGYVDYKGDAPSNLIGDGTLNWTRRDLFSDGLRSTKFGSATKVRDTATDKFFTTDFPLGSKGFISYQADFSGVVSASFALMSLRFNSGPNTLIWTTNSGTTLNFRINGSTVTLTPPSQLVGGGGKSVVLYWDESAQERGLIIDGKVVDTDSTAFTWVSNSAGQFCPVKDTGVVLPEGIVLSSQSFGEYSSLSELIELTKNPYQILKPANPIHLPIQVSGGGGTTLNADSGTFAQTGTDASLKADRLLSAISGSYTATTDAVNLLADRIIAAATGGYTAGGQDASLLADRTVNAGAGSYTLTGQDVALLKQASLVMAAGSGAFALNTQSAQLLFNRVMPAASGSITLTGQDVTLQYVAGSTLVAGSGDFLASGGDVALVVDRKMQAATGSLTAVYDDAGLVRGYVMDATGENLTLTGQDLNLLLDRALQAGTATFTETGSPVVLLYSGVGLFPDLEGEITLVSVTPKITLQSKTPKITVH